MDKYEETTSSSVFAPPVPERDTSDEDTAVEYDDSLGGASPLSMPTTEVTVVPNTLAHSAGGDSVFDPVGSNDESQHAEPSAEPEFDFSAPPVVGDVEVEATAPEDDGQEGAPPGDDEPPVPGDEASDGDNGGRKGRSRVRRAMPWVIIIAAILALAAFVVYQVASDDQTLSPQEVATDVADRVQSVCQTGEYPESLAEVGVLRYGDSLSYNDIQPFWNSESIFQGDADDIFGNIVTQLYDTDGDGCTPAGVAYWRYLLPHVIDADRVGVDNHDARVRIESYTDETDTRIAVAEETARQFANCRDMQYVNLTVEDAPRIYVAAYTADYDDVVFVQTPLLQVDALADGQSGLIVVHCQFGKSEGVNDSYVNEAFISPTLRAIVYRDQPTGGTVVVLDPDDDTQEASEEAGAREEESAASVDQEANGSTEPDVQVTPEAPQPEPEPQPEPQPDDDTREASEEAGAREEESAASVDQEANGSTEPDVQVTPEAPQPEPEPQPEPQPQPETNQDAAGQSSVGEVQEEPTGPLPTEPEQDVPAITENPQPTEQQSTEEDQQDADANQPEPQPEPESEPQPEAQQPESQPEPESTTGGSGEGCGGSCGDTEEGSGDQGSDTGGNTGTVDTGDQGADDCPNGDCPGDGGGNDGDDCTNGDCPGNGGDDDGDDCTNGDCPGNGDDDGGEDDGGGPEPACLPGEIVDPFGNCKAPDPGPAGF